jgi:filamentous hemagglutinin
MAGVSALPTAIEYGVGQAAWPALVKAGGTIASWLCLRDGDCINEARSVWQLNPFQRGVAIENSLGRSPQLVQNFPVIDRFQNGVATSIKSIDLGARGYQNIATLTRTVRGYVNTMANWQGVSSWGGVTIRNGEIMAREVLLAIPPGASQAQMNALLQVQQLAVSQGVTLNIVVVP